MDIIIQKKVPLKNERTDAWNLFKPIKKLKNKNHRKSRQDRRKNLRDGIIVSLSSAPDRRSTCGRRKTDYQIWTGTRG